MRKNFGTFLENELEKRNITQREFADKLNVREATISRYINNHQMPRWDMISNMARILNTTTDFLLGNEQVNSEQYDEEIQSIVVACEDDKTKTMMKHFRELSDKDKDIILSVAERIKADIDKKEF